MKAFLIDPLKVGDRVVAQVDLDNGLPSADDAWLKTQICALLSLPDLAELEEFDLPQSGTLYMAGSARFEEVRRLGEFRILKADGSYRSVAGRGVVVGFAGEAEHVVGLLASSGVWVSA